MGTALHDGRTHRALAAVLAGSALVCLAGSAGPAAGDSDAVLAEMGSPYFQRHCASCHGVEARGDGPVASVLSTPPPDLTRIAARRGGSFPEGEIARHIDGRFQLAAHGTREMPIWGNAFASDVPESSVAEEIARGKIAMLVEYLKSIQVQEKNDTKEGR
jgi:mono/diheme cytochrome c family protein